MLLEPKLVIPKVIESMPLEGSLFYDIRHRNFVDKAMLIWSSGKPFDVISLLHTLKGKMDDVGGMDYVLKNQEQALSSNIDYYLDILREQYVLRQMLKTCTEAAARIYSKEFSNPSEIVDSVSKEILRISTTNSSKGFKPARQFVIQAMEEIEYLSSSETQIVGKPSGYPDLDHYTMGFQDGTFVVLAARPSVGKTAISLNMAQNIVKGGSSVGFVSIEMPGKRLLRRMIHSLSGVPVKDVRRGIAEVQTLKISKAAAELSKAALFVDDSSDMTIMQLRAKGRQLKDESNIGILFVDYLQLLKSPGKDDSRQREVSDISNGLKSLAKELDIPVIALSQLNRSVEKDSVKARPPRMSDLRESGSLEQDADVIILMHPMESSGDNVIKTRLNVAKHRDGPTGEVTLMFLKQFSRFESAARTEEPEEDLQEDMSRRWVD